MVVPEKICAPLTDQQIIRMAREEADFFSCLFSRYEEALLRYIHRLTDVEHAQAEDILQEAFIQIWRNINAYDEQMKFSSWAYRIVHNKAISSWRKSRSFGKHKQLSLAAFHEDTALLQEELQAAAPDIETEQALQTALAELSEKYRSVITLYYLEEKNYQEISDILRLPEGTVATRLNRARQKLRLALQARRYNT